MMRQYELVERVKRYNPRADEALLDRAYVYAMLAHGSQKRASGDPYFSHPLEVAAILTDLKLDDATIVAALLHDTIEDTAATKDDIRDKFGANIAELVDGLTKLKKLDLVSKQAVQAENLRKLLLAITSDVRVLLVKLADRLHNMRTLHYVLPAKRDRVAQETLDIYAPLAGRMGMHDMREELEDLAFRQINPEAYEALVSRLARQRDAMGKVIEEIETQLTRKLAGEGISAEVTGRQKKPYSIYRKMERKSVSFEQLSDIVAFRILVDTIADCYRAVGIIHTTWPAVPLRFKDYISTPKGNDYRSIHTTVIGPESQRVEMQIRTRQMHDIAEYGIAAHALYKDGAADSASSESSAYAWLRHTVDMLAHGDNPEEFLEHTKLELFSDQVYCFTPKGRLIALPRKANCIDFAYAVHTDIGNHCSRARINGVERPLVTELQNGDEVEIITDPKATPSAAWESIVVTGRARSAIRRATRMATRAQYLELGRRIVQTLFTRAGKPFSDDIIRLGLKRLARGSVEDVFSAVGRDEIPAEDVLKSVHPDFKGDVPLGPKPTAEWFGVGGETALKFQVPESEGAIPIRGINFDLPVSFAREGGAVPGDRIVGILTHGEGITIYPIQSPALAAYDNEPERWLDVRWDVDEGKRARYPARIAVKSRNAPGSLAAVTQVIADNDGNIDNLRMQRSAADYTNVVIDLEVWDLKHLNAIIAGIRGLPITAEAGRVFE
jgi:GTP pyrophosphokinase